MRAFLLPKSFMANLLSDAWKSDSIWFLMKDAFASAKTGPTSSLGVPYKLMLSFSVKKVSPPEASLTVMIGGDLTLFRLKFISREIKSLTNSSVDSLTSNEPVLLCFNRSLMGLSMLMLNSCFFFRYSAWLVAWLLDCCWEVDDGSDDLLLFSLAFWSFWFRERSRLGDEDVFVEEMRVGTWTGKHGRCFDGLSTTSTTAVRGTSTVLSKEILALPLKEPLLKFSRFPFSFLFLSPEVTFGSLGDDSVIEEWSGSDS